MSDSAFLPDLSGLLGDILEAARSMSRRSLMQSAWRDGLPTLLALGGVRAELNCERTETDTNRLVWKRIRTTRPILALNLRLDLAASVFPAPARAVPARAVLEIPDFLASVGEGDALHLGLPGQDGLRIGFPTPGSLEIAGKTVEVVQSRWADPNFEGDTLGEWPVDALVDCVDRVADWRRRGEPRVAMTFEATGTGDLPGTLRGVTGAYGEVLAALDRAAGPPAGHAALPVPLALKDFATDVQIYQSDRGDLALETLRLDRQRVDLAARVAQDADGPVIRLSLGLTDIQIAGEKFQGYIDLLKEKAAAKNIQGGLDAMADHLPEDFPGLDEKQVAQYLKAPEHAECAVVARMRHDETDLVWLRGPAAGFDVDFLCQVAPQSREERRRHILLAARKAGGAWIPATAENLAPRYFFRLFHSLRAWQSMLRGEAP